jgi:hypothetical protein
VIVAILLDADLGAEVLAIPIIESEPAKVVEWQVISLTGYRPA